MNRLPQNRPTKPSRPELKRPQTAQTINEKLKQKFGLAWTQQDYNLKEVVFDEQDYAE